MGFPVHLCVDKPSHDIICSLCHGLLQDPIMVGADCEHIFCRSCILTWCAHTPPDKDTICPLDGKSIPGIEAVPEVMCSFLNRVKLYCQFKNLGCREILTVEGFVDHEKKCKLNADNYVDCKRGCGAKVWKIGQESHQCVEYLKGENQDLKTEVTDLKKKNDSLASLVNEMKKKLETSLLPADWKLKPDGIYGLCIYEHPGKENFFLDLKLGDIIEIEKHNFGHNSHLGIKNGVKGLVSASFVRILTYEKLIEGYDVAQCIKPMVLPWPMLTVPYLDVIQIICKDVRFCHQEYGPDCLLVGWLANAHGRIGYVNPNNFKIIK